MNNHRKGINNRFNLQICYDPKFRTFTKGLFLCHTDGKTQTMLDFSLHGEEGKNPEKKQGLTDKQRKARFNKKR